jgi:putative PIN family toxin of toxin-antitoxin system
MNPVQIVIDTNVFISALRSKKGASFKLFSMIESTKFEINISVPLVFEYEEVAKRNDIVLSYEEIDDIIDFICQIGTHHEIFFLWRPYLKVPTDDMILELAVKSQSEFIITYNKKDFEGIEKFGIKVLTAKEFLQKIGEI